MAQLIVHFQQTHVLQFEWLPTGREIKDRLYEEGGVPSELIALQSDGRLLDDDSVVDDKPTIIVRASLAGGLRGGKGGFGAQLRALAKQKAHRKTVDFGACRDLSGRRLRHVNDELLLQKWKESKDRGETFSADETPTGIDLWFLSAPAWAEGVKVDKRKQFLKPRRGTVLCIDWTRARERRPAPPGAPAHWGCPRGRRCEFAHGVEQMQGDAREKMVEAEARKKREEAGAKKDAYLDVLYRAAKQEDELADLVMTGLRAAKRTKLLASGAIASSGEIVGTGVVGPAGEEKFSGAEEESEGAEGADLDPAQALEEEGMSMEYLRVASGNVLVTRAKGSAVGAESAGDAGGEGSVRNCPEVTGVSSFATVLVDVEAFDCGAMRRGGGWYYEVTMLSDGLMQLGWADGDFVPSSGSGSSGSGSSGQSGGKASGEEKEQGEAVEADGVGDDSHSWGYDGYRQMKWHNGGSAAYGPQTGSIWKAGDVVGCYLQLTPETGTKKRKAAVAEAQGTISYSVNGTYYGAAFEFPVQSLADLSALRPAVSLEAQESLVLNLGNSPFKYAPNEVCNEVLKEGGSASKGKKGKGAKASVPQFSPFYDLIADSAPESVDKGSEAEPKAALETQALVPPSKSKPTKAQGETVAALETQAPVIPSKSKPTKAQAGAEAGAGAEAAQPSLEFQDIDLASEAFADLSQVEALGPQHLKFLLDARALKSGGTLQERAQRLMSVRGLQPEQIDNKLKAKKTK
ncbi:hypothetical protein B484DRAFT_429054 [Ochromonadaceae sp. CCMP2298]|nr:hypothetical protein B484DRAFT_429054 [Ochromonadaceae sp. CCMP2298]